MPLNCLVNVTMGALPRFYIFKGERIKNDYIRYYKLGTHMAMETKAWRTTFLFNLFFSFFNKSIFKGHISIKSISTSVRWAWFTCYIGSYKTSTTTWVGYGHLTFLHFPCFIATKCELFQAFQIYFQKIEKQCHG